MGRAPCCDKANVKKGPWSPEEDDKLKSYIQEHGTGGNWIALPHKIGLKRCGKSCRLRWLNYLRPNIKHGGFSEEEDRVICSLYVSIGSRWSIIAAQLPGRTDNDIKNYWNTRLKKKLLGRKSRDSNNPNNPNPNNGALSSSALERLQLHMHLQALRSPCFSFINNKLPNYPDRQMLQALSSEAAIVTEVVSVPLKHPAADDEKVMASNPVLESMEEGSLGFPSSSSACSNYNNMDPELVVLHDDHRLDCLKEEEGMMNWAWGSSSCSCCSCNIIGFDHEKSSSSSWDSTSLLQHDAVNIRGYCGMEYNL